MADIQTPATLGPPKEEERPRRDRARTATKRYSEDFYVGDSWTKSRKFEEAVKRDKSASQSESAEDEETIVNIRHLVTGNDEIAVGAEEVVEEFEDNIACVVASLNASGTVSVNNTSNIVGDNDHHVTAESISSSGCANCGDSQRTGRIRFQTKIPKTRASIITMLNELYDGTISFSVAEADSYFLCVKCSNDITRVFQAMKQAKEAAKSFRDRTRRGLFIHDKLKVAELAILKTETFNEKLTEVRAKQQVAAEMKRMAEQPLPPPPVEPKIIKQPPLKVKLPIKKSGQKTRSTQTPKQKGHSAPYAPPVISTSIKHESGTGVSASSLKLKRNAKPWQRRVVRNFIRGSYLAAFRKSLENSSKARKAFMDAMAFMIDKEVKAKVESQTGILRQPFNTEVVESFSWRALIEELSDSLPFLTTAVRAAIRIKSMKGRSKENNRARNKILCLGSILAQIMFIRNTCCRLVQIANAVMMWYNSCPKMLFRAFNSLGFCLSRESVKQFVSMDQKAIDKRMLKWRKKILFPKKFDSRIHETSTEYLESSSEDDSEEEDQSTEDTSESESEVESSTEEEDEHGMIPVKQESIVEERGIYSSHASHIHHIVGDEIMETMETSIEQTEEGPAPDAEGENQSTKCIIQRIANDPQILEEAVWSIQNDENDVAMAQNLVELSESGHDGDKQIVLVVVPNEEDGETNIHQMSSDGNVIIHIPNNEDGHQYFQEACLSADGQNILQQQQL